MLHLGVAAAGVAAAFQLSNAGSKPCVAHRSSRARRAAATTTAAGAARADEVDLVELLSTCVDACERGCAEIRRVAAELERTADGAVADVDYKIEGDARSALTAADLAAQARSGVGCQEVRATRRGGPRHRRERGVGPRRPGREARNHDVDIPRRVAATPRPRRGYSEGGSCDASTRSGRPPS